MRKILIGVAIAACALVAAFILKPDPDALRRQIRGTSRTRHGRPPSRGRG